MGSFSWLKADTLTTVENIAFGKPFKFLIPIEFDGGFIKDKYQDYGYLGYKTLEEDEYFIELNKVISKEIIIELRKSYNKYDLKSYDNIISDNNIIYNYNDLMNKVRLIGLFNSKYDMYELLAMWNAPDKVKFSGKYNPMKQIDEHTDFNRSVGINIGCYDEDIDELKFPLKLVSVSFKGSYEDLDKPSYIDPNQGFFESKRKLT